MYLFLCFCSLRGKLQWEKSQVLFFLIVTKQEKLKKRAPYREKVFSQAVFSG
jgi:hypothetical protein